MLYEGETSSAELAAFGFSPEDYQGEDEFAVWPDNWQALDVFCAMQTQWRFTQMGPTGLDYSALESTLRLRGVRKRDRADVFEAVRIMESAALAVMREK